MANNIGKLFHFSLSVVFLVLFVSCQTHDNKEYPKYLNFPAEGGELFIEGETPFSGITIEESGKTVAIDAPGDDDSIVASFDWLTVKSKKGNNSLDIIVKPNESHKKRKLYIYLYFFNQYAEIKVTQNGK